MNVGAVVKPNRYMIVVQLKAYEMIGADAKLNGCGNVTNTRRDDKFYFCEYVAVCVENLHAGG